jgi:methylphosphotriester-DNA--protein-cysteine methyltransferase
MISTGISPDDEEFFQALKDLDEEARGKLFQAVKSTEVAYSTPPELRTEEQKILVQEHEQWKDREQENTL